MEVKEKERVFGVHLGFARSRRKGNFSTKEKGLGPCQVRSKTDLPCPYPAVVKIQDVPFCERCAREQEAYFAIGELTQRVRERQNSCSLCNELVRRIVRAEKRGRISLEPLAAR